jgi:hypothetical protein
MTKDWFEMAGLRRKTFETSVWIPLFEMTNIEKTGKYGFVGYKEEFFGVGSVLIPVDQFDRIDKLNWSNVGIGHDTRVGVEDDGRYNQCDLLDENWYGIKGIFPVLRQSINSEIHRIWHLHQDLLIALELIREGDIWIAPNEDYIIMGPSVKTIF